MSHPDQWFGGETFAQHGDDLAILNIFKRIGIDFPTYLDIGAHHPTEISNTALLHKRGSRGINVEPHPILFKEFPRRRPHDVNLNVGVGPVPGTLPFYMASAPGRSSFIKEEAVGLVRTIDVYVNTVHNIVGPHGPEDMFPDLLTIDVEGLDFAVLQSINYRGGQGAPKVICTEVYKRGPEIRALLEANDYAFAAWCGWNMIFVQEKYRGLVL